MKKIISISKYVYIAFVIIMAICCFFLKIFPTYFGFIKDLTNGLTGVFTTLILLRIRMHKNTNQPIEISKYVYPSFLITIVFLGLLQAILPNHADFIKNLNSGLTGVYITLIILRIQYNGVLMPSTAL